MRIRRHELDHAEVGAGGQLWFCGLLVAGFSFPDVWIVPTAGAGAHHIATDRPPGCGSVRDRLSLIVMWAWRRDRVRGSVTVVGADAFGQVGPLGEVAAVRGGAGDALSGDQSGDGSAIRRGPGPVG